MNRVYLVRHGRTAWNQSRRYTGQADPPLDPAGRRQAVRLSAGLAGVRFDAAYTSDLRRASETARCILHGQAAPCCQDRRLREAAFGLWEGLTFAEASARYPAEVQAWLAEPLDAAPPDGESLRVLCARATDALREILAEGEGRTILLVTHGGPARVIVCAALGLPPADHWRIQIDPGGLAVLEFHAEKGILCRLENGGDLRS